MAEDEEQTRAIGRRLYSKILRTTHELGLHWSNSRIVKHSKEPTSSLAL